MVDENTVLDFVGAIMILRDPYENGHDLRVAALTDKLAKQLALPDAYMDVLRPAARLHDVGKLVIAEAVINKPKLTTSERRMIQSHAELGAKIIHALHWHDEIENIVHHHHEKWNGTGYPDKLKGIEIPIGARVLSITDAFDGISSRRPYHESRSIEETLAIMRAENRTSFDPEIFSVFEKMIKT